MPKQLLQRWARTELANAGAALANTEIHWENVEDNLDLALGLAADPQAAYRCSDPAGRRALNQAIFEALYVDQDGVTYTRLADPFAQLVAEGVAADLERVLKNPSPNHEGQGLKEARLVELTTST